MPEVKVILDSVLPKPTQSGKVYYLASGKTEEGESFRGSFWDIKLYEQLVGKKGSKVLFVYERKGEFNNISDADFSGIEQVPAQTVTTSSQVATKSNSNRNDPLAVRSMACSYAATRFQGMKEVSGEEEYISRRVAYILTGEWEPEGSKPEDPAETVKEGFPNAQETGSSPSQW